MPPGAVGRGGGSAPGGPALVGAAPAAPPLDPARSGGSRPGPGPGPGDLGTAHLDRIRKFKETISSPEYSFCPQPVGFCWRVVDGQTIIQPISCKRYDCPSCGKVKKNRIADMIRDGTCRIRDDHTLPRSQRMVRLLTLTQHLDDPTPIMTAYNRFRTNLRDKGYRNIRYFWVKEFTRKGKRHLHVLINQFVPQAILAASWKAATDGWSYIIHIQRSSMTVRNPAGYFSKYVGKAVHDSQFEKGEHRYGHDHQTDWTAYTTWKPDPLARWKFEYCPVVPMKGGAMHPEGTLPGPGPDPP